MRGFYVVFRSCMRFYPTREEYISDVSKHPGLKDKFVAEFKDVQALQRFYQEDSLSLKSRRKSPTS